MREALRQVKPTEFEDLIALVALYRPGPMSLHPGLRAAEGGAGGGHVPRPAPGADHRPHLRHLHLPGAVHGDRQAARRLHARRGRRSPQGDRQEDPRADGVAEGQVPRGVRGELGHARGREPALEGHGAGAGLLVQQVARRLLRAHRLPHRVAAGPPPEGVHGGADLLGDEHEGPRAVLRQRVPRDRDRGAAAGRELVRVRLRRRRGADPVRPERGQERRRLGGAGDRQRARGGRPVRVALGLHRARRPAGREQARARVAGQVRRARLDGRLAARDARGAGARALARAARLGRAAARTELALRRGRGEARAPADRLRGVREERAPAAGEGDARPLRLRAPARGDPRRSSGARPTRRSPSSSAAATARS